MEVSGSLDVNLHGGCGKDGETILDEAARITSQDRNGTYGHPLDNHSLTAEFWTEFLRRRGLLKDGARLHYSDVCMLNIMQKVSRYANRPTRDGLVDIAGFARNIEMAEMKEMTAKSQPIHAALNNATYFEDALCEMLGDREKAKAADATPSAPTAESTAP